MRKLGVAAAVLALSSMAVVRADDDSRFAALRGLSGTWTGVAYEGEEGRKMPARAVFRMVSAGSVVMLTTDPGTAHEMVTLFHQDDGALMATHYCAAQNQPRFRALPVTDPRRLIFEFVDGTNLGAHPGRMQRLVISLPDRNHQVQEWTYRQGEQESVAVFELRRRKG